MRVAIVYDRINKWGGAERVLLALHEMFPDAPLYTSLFDEKKAPWAKVFTKIHTSFLQNIPFAKSNHEFLAPLMPIAFEQFNFDNYEVVISVTSESAKGVITKPDTLHICYCLTPNRYLWSGYEEYFKSPFLRFLSLPIIRYLRYWDKIAALRPDNVIAISTEVKSRIEKYYHRQSEIIFPPMDSLGKIKKSEDSKDFYLLVGRMVPYKKMDLVIKTFNLLNKPLYIVGSGSEEWKLKLLAKRNIKFLGQVTDSKLSELYSKAKALILPQLEDYGIVSVEAQSYGVPVIAYKAGGSLDTVIDGETGIFFEKQNIESLTNAIEKFEKMSFNIKLPIANAKRFTKQVFKRRLQEALIRTNNSRRRGNSSLATF